MTERLDVSRALAANTLAWLRHRSGPVHEGAAHRGCSRCMQSPKTNQNAALAANDEHENTRQEHGKTRHPVVHGKTNYRNAWSSVEDGRHCGRRAVEDPLLSPQPDIPHAAPTAKCTGTGASARSDLDAQVFYYFLPPLDCHGEPGCPPYWLAVLVWKG